MPNNSLKNNLEGEPLPLIKTNTSSFLMEITLLVAAYMAPQWLKMSKDAQLQFRKEMSERFRAIKNK